MSGGDNWPEKPCEGDLLHGVERRHKGTHRVKEQGAELLLLGLPALPG